MPPDPRQEARSVKPLLELGQFDNGGAAARRHATQRMALRRRPSSHPRHLRPIRHLIHPHSASLRHAQDESSRTAGTHRTRLPFPNAPAGAQNTAPAERGDTPQRSTAAGETAPEPARCPAAPHSEIGPAGERPYGTMTARPTSKTRRCNRSLRPGHGDLSGIRLEGAHDSRRTKRETPNPRAAPYRAYMSVTWRFLPVWRSEPGWLLGRFWLHIGTAAPEAFGLAI